MWWCHFRSLRENSRFKQLIEVLLETIHAFELDTGVKSKCGDCTSPAFILSKILTFVLKLFAKVSHFLCCTRCEKELSKAFSWLYFSWVAASYKTILLTHTYCHAQWKKMVLPFFPCWYFSVLNSHHLPKTEATADLLCEDHSVIQSKGFRNRKKSTKGNGQETSTLVCFSPSVFCLFVWNVCLHK